MTILKSILGNRFAVEILVVLALVLAFNFQLHKTRVAEQGLAKATVDKEVAAVEAKMQARENLITSLRDEIAKRETIVSAQQLQIDHLTANRPIQSEVTKRVELQTATDPDLVAAALRIASVHVRVASVCQ